MESKLKLPGLLFLGIGYVIGAGIVSTIGAAFDATGYSMGLAFLIACLLSYLRLTPYIFFSSCVETTGGKQEMITLCAGEKYGGLMAVSSLLALFSKAIAVAALKEYIGFIFPGVNGMFAAGIIWLRLCVLNLTGVNKISKIQNLVTPIMLCSFLIFSTLCFKRPLNYGKSEFLLNGTEGFFTAVVLLSYSCEGVSSLLSFFRQTENPKKNIPLSMFLTNTAVGVIYTTVGFAACRLMNIGEYNNLLTVAKQIFTPVPYRVFLICSPLTAIITTMNSGIASSAVPIKAAAEKGYLPKFLSFKNRNGIRYFTVGVIFFFGFIPPAFGLSVSRIVNMTVITNSISTILILLSAINMPFVLKEKWENSNIHIPDKIYFFLVFLCRVTEIFLIFQSVKNLSAKVLTANFVVLILAVVYSQLKNARKNRASKYKIKEVF